MNIIMSAKYMDALKSQLSHSLDLEKSLADFETRYNMDSDTFFEKFDAGELGDDSEYIKWYAYKDTHNRLTSH